MKTHTANTAAFSAAVYAGGFETSPGWTEVWMWPLSVIRWQTDRWKTVWKPLHERHQVAAAALAFGVSHSNIVPTYTLVVLVNVKVHYRK